MKHCTVIIILQIAVFGCFMLSGFNAAADDALYGYTSQTHRWYDAARHRTVPARIYIPQTAAEKQFPVIVFSHGIGGSIDCCSYLARAWTSRGFVCLFVQHPGSDENIWKGKVRILNEIKKSYERNKNCRTRAEDLRFALDTLQQLAERDDDFGKKIDFTQIGVGGYDLGALTSLLVAGQLPPDYGTSLHDPRFTAALAMSPPVRRMNVGYKTIYKDVAMPVLFITGTKDDSVVGTTQAVHRRIPFDSMTDNDRWLITLNGADHRIYGGRIFSLTANNDEVFQAAIVRASTNFWKAVLQEDEKALSVMHSSGLNSLVRIAKVERRINSLSVKNEPDTQEEAKEQQAEQQNELPAFPISHYYRSIEERVNNEISTFSR
ncbi:MAG: hypothetical protein FWE67_12605 [Planctomycetaceae bacterium]|nr:hypothetical protein [Planctomycetaceae bacterium]